MVEMDQYLVFAKLETPQNVGMHSSTVLVNLAIHTHDHGPPVLYEPDRTRCCLQFSVQTVRKRSQNSSWIGRTTTC